MRWLWQRIMGEPVMTQGLVQAALACGVAFGLSLSAEQTGALLAVSAAVLAFLTRQTVTPVASPKAADGTPLVPATGGASATGAAGLQGAS